MSGESTGPPPPEQQEWVEALLRRIGDHVVAEKSVLERYRGLRSRAERRDVRYLIDLITEEEERHHARFAEIVNAMRRDFGDEVSGPAVPELSDTSLALDLAATTLEMLFVEESDAEELRRLASELSRLPRRTMWPLLVETMIADTEKHTAILRYILELAEGGGEES